MAATLSFLQVIIKLEGSEPGQLRQDVVGNVDSVLHATG
jgi:hypothetical protein